MSNDQLLELLWLSCQKTRLLMIGMSGQQLEIQIEQLLEQNGKTKDQLPQLLAEAFRLVAADQSH